MNQLRIAIAAVLILLAPPAQAWGPHSEITVAAARALDKDDPFLKYINNDMAVLRGIGWANDNAQAGAIVDFHGYRVYARDFFDSPAYPIAWGSDTGGGYDLKDGCYEAFFKRTLQAMQTESADNAIGWFGAMTHLMEDSGAPPHAGHVPWKYHLQLEGWIDPNKVHIEGYKPVLLGKTPEEALAALLKRAEALHKYSVDRAKKCMPLVDKNDRPAAEALILESALESTRVMADVMHTLGYLQSQLKPVEEAGGLAGTITPGANFEKVTPKVMLLGTNYSTLADTKGRYEFRDIPAGKYKVAIMLPTCTPKLTEVTIQAGKTASFDAELAKNDNLLRNGDQSVRFLSKDQPDGWFKMLNPKPDQPQWLSELFTAMRGQAFKLTIKWKKDSAGNWPDAQAAVLYHWNGWDDKNMLKAGAESMVFHAPEKMDGRDFANVYVRCKGNPWDAIESVTVRAEKP